MADMRNHEVGSPLETHSVGIVMTHGSLPRKLFFPLFGEVNKTHAWKCLNFGCYVLRRHVLNF
jgi:hypothetical protein